MGLIQQKLQSSARDSGVDAMAISVGNVHLQQDKEGGLDLTRIAEIEAMTSIPLVIHGGGAFRKNHLCRSST